MYVSVLVYTRNNITNAVAFKMADHDHYLDALLLLQTDPSVKKVVSYRCLVKEGSQLTEFLYYLRKRNKKANE